VRPHAVSVITGSVNGVVNPSFNYDANGNLLNGAGRTATWMSFNMPNTLSQGSGTTAIADAFLYGPEHQRIRQTQRTGTTVNKTIYYAGAIEKTIDSSGSVSVKTYLPQGLGVIIETSSATTPNTATCTATNYFHTDHLGSVGVISDGSGAVKERLSYDPFGKRRNLTGTDDGSVPPANLKGVIDNKGYTGHEMLDNIGLVHMNGRVYDPLTGRFISADPFISDPDTSQTFNRYSYVNNNPLAYTDPSGYAGDTPFNSVWDPAGSQPSNDFVVKAQSGLGFQVVYDANAGWLSPMQSAQSGMAGGASVTNIASPTPTQQDYQVSHSWNSTGRQFGDAGIPIVEKVVTTAKKSTLPFEDLPLPCAGICDISDIVLGTAKGIAAAGALIGAGIKSVGKSAAAKGAAAAGGTIFKTAHYASRLESAGVNVARAESAVTKEVSAMRGSLATNADTVGRLKVDGVLVEYRARLLENGTVNVGSLFPVK
jgi:RHS repeat-associated protein